MKTPTSRTLWAELRPVDPACKQTRRRGGGEVGDGVSDSASRQHTGELGVGAMRAGSTRVSLAAGTVQAGGHAMSRQRRSKFGGGYGVSMAAATHRRASLARGPSASKRERVSSPAERHGQSSSAGKRTH
jgi:hypothetical protein